MEVIVHRGINQIGGCITEIATSKSRVLIDFGQNLPDGEGNIEDSFANLDAINELTKNIDAIFYTHYHGDHLGLFQLVPDSVPQYIGAIAKKVALCKHRRLVFIKGREELSKKEIEKLESMYSFEAKQKIKIGNIKVTPYLVSHSAYDAYMFLIEANGLLILHTGDFRGHGYLSKGLLPTIEKLILNKGRIDFLITEGTMLSRLDEKVRHENELKREVIELMKQYKNVFVLCSSTDMERLATFHTANKEIKDRPFVCDDFQKSVLEIFSKSAGKISPLFDFKEPYTFWKENSKLIKWIQDKGCCMLVRPTEKFNNYTNHLLPLLEKENTILIYSMWKEYINPKSKHCNKRYLGFVQQFPSIRKIHTSGHASADCLAEVCNLVNPTKGIIPIHSEKSAYYQKLPIKEELKSKIIIESARTKNIIIIEIKK
ncbi:MBL fold metallo-hydrolase [Saccharicrinis aurantiacus]|uniref:MBL fold metallo-hydrolase n=1 Tax=Saccharicrinis aurantiacus TaxID=1849719 RepID=UPI002492B7EF|nr:MBL fold metallo-hydrolase [Saccharicrinis aurantiacus]